MRDERLLVCVLAAPGEDPAPSVAALLAAGIAEPAVVGLEAPGAWAAARNAALERAAGHEGLGLVEAGVLVGAGWGEAAHAALDAGVGAAGGPLLAARTAPGALDPVRHAQALGLSGDTAAPAPGNAVLRTAALRAAGGFPPVRGHRAAVDGLSDWHLALEAIAAAGWPVITEEGLAATRDLEGLRLRTVLRRHLHSGARRAVLAPAPGGGAAGAAVRSAGGAASRLLRGDRAGAADRAAWAAAQAGQALGPWLAHAELQPDRARTPWRPSVAAAQPGPLARRLPRPGARSGRPDGLVLLYHRVADLPDDPLAVSVTPAHFAEQMEHLARARTVAPLADVVSGRAGPGAVAITFDDGYLDNKTGAAPVLARLGLPATLFAATGPIARGEGFWWDTVPRLLAAGIAAGQRAPLVLALPGGERAWRPGPGTPLHPLAAQVQAGLRACGPQQVAAALAALAAWAGADPAPPEADRPLTAAELAELDAGPFEVQSHGRDHLCMALVPAAERAADLQGAADDLERWLGRRPDALAYPFGVPGADVDAASERAAADAGYRIAVVNAPGRLRGSRPHAVPRAGVPDVGGAAFARWLDAAGG